MGQQSSKSATIEQETVGSNGIAQESELNKELKIQPEKRRRIMDDEQSMVTYGLEQGSSSNSQLTCPLEWLSNNSAMYPKIMDLKRKWDRLTARQCDIVTELEHAEFQPGQKRRAEVHHWLTEVQRIKDKIRSMIKDGQGTSSNSNLSGSIESLIKEVDELIERSKFSNGLVLLHQESTRLPLLLDRKPVGTDFQWNAGKIMGWLQNHEHGIIGVYGMGGVGKTTLLTHIHDQLLKDSNLSTHVYWDDERKRAAVLHDRLAAMGRTVLFLDDMWEQFSGSRVGIPLNNRNCKIILSTRLYDVCRKMGCKDFVIKAEILPEGEAWDLFSEKLGHYDTLEEEAKKIAWDVAKECGGLPLALSTMARSMTGVVDKYEWKTALNDLKSARVLDDMEEDVFRILRFSYDRLKDKRVQECFLSCILYIEDMKTKRTTLVDLWISEGLLDEIESRDAQVAKGHVILNKLESSCLLESCLEYYQRKCVKMHDLIRDMAIIITKVHPLFIAKAGEQLKELPEGEKWNKDLVKVSLSHNQIEEIPSDMAPMTPNLKVLMLNENPLKEIPDSFFVHMRALTHLDLCYTDIERVPKSVSDLENLRGLLLGGCEELIYVPSVAKLTKLRILDLEYCHKLNEAPRGLEILVSLEELRYIPWDVSDLIGFNEVVQSLTSLRCFRFVVQDPKLSRSDCIELDLFYEYDKVIWIYGVEYGGDMSSTPILVPAITECLAILKSEMKGLSCLGDIFLSQGEATGLKGIYIDECRGLKYILDSAGGCHSLLCTTAKLETLWLEGLPDLRSIVKIRMPQPFSQLRDLFLSWCPKLKVMFPFTDELYLPNLKSIDVRNCEELEELFGSDKAILSSNPTISLPKLKEMTLKYLPKIKVIFPFMKELHLPNLEYIYLIACKEVEEIFETNKKATATPSPNSNPTLKLPNLHILRLEDLPELGSIYSGLLLCTTTMIKINADNCPKLKWWRLPGGGLTSDESCFRAMKSHHISSINLNEPAACLPHFDELPMDFSKQTLPLTDHFHSFNQPAYIIPHSQRNSDDDDVTQWGTSLSL